MIGSRRAKLVFTALVVTLLPACYSWHATDLSPERYIAASRPEAARLVLTDGTVLTLEEPEIMGDAVVGAPIVSVPLRRGPESSSTDIMPPLIRTPLDDVTAVEERRLNPGRTAVAIGAVAATAVAIIVSVFSPRTHLGGCSPSGC